MNFLGIFLAIGCIVAAMMMEGTNPTMMLVMSVLALITNVVALGYIIWKSVKTKTNPYTGEVFTDFKYYKDAAARAIIE